MSELLGTGERKNEGKLKYELLEPFAIEQIVKIFTKGSIKYAPFNWLKGMSWSKMIASMKRHISAFENGKDYDKDPNCEGCKSGNCINHTGELHIALAAWNALALTSYYKYFPQGDDRLHTFVQKPKIGLDIDEVLCDWISPWCKKFGYETPNDWNFSYEMKKHFEEDLSKEELEKFYMDLPRKIDPSEISFPIDCYITSRSVDTELTKSWLLKNGFPAKPVYSLGIGQSKLETAKNVGIDWFIDDNYQTYLEMNKEGICCFLMDCPHNQKFSVGYKRIKDFKDFTNRFL